MSNVLTSSDSPRSGGPRPKGLPSLLVLAIVILIGSALVWLMGSANPQTRAGYVGYVTQDSIFGKSRFLAIQVGPTSLGRTWLAKVVNVSITPFTFSEEFANERSVLAKDNLKLAFSVHVVFRIKPEEVKDFIEKYSTLHEGEDPTKVVEVAYQEFIREPLRTYARAEIERFDGLEAKNHITEMGENVSKRVIALVKDKPFEITSVVVGNIQYPTEVADAVSKKVATLQQLEQRQTEIKIAEAEAQRRVAEAKGSADAMNLITERLTPAYLQYLAIEAQKTALASPHSAAHTTVYIPVGPMGVPLVGAIDPVKGK